MKGNGGNADRLSRSGFGGRKLDLVLGVGGLFAFAVEGAVSLPGLGEGFGLLSAKPEPEGLESLGWRCFPGLAGGGCCGLAEEEGGGFEGFPPAIALISGF